MSSEEGKEEEDEQNTTTLNLHQVQQLTFTTWLSRGELVDERKDGKIRGWFGLNKVGRPKKKQK